MSDLKPCMKCGSTDVGASQGKAYCYLCGITTKQHVTNAAAVRDWNSRSEADELQPANNDLIKALKEMLSVQEEGCSFVRGCCQNHLDLTGDGTCYVGNAFKTLEKHK